MADSFFFYDLETSSFNPRQARIMQFAGQRTDMELHPVGEPFNLLIKMTPEVVPDPDAVLVTGITPQATLADGLTEAEFLKVFFDDIVQPGTIFLGYNSVRFDDEFMRYLLYRNFYDPYQWQYYDDCSRWDLLDVVRMTRALRPDGINWPFNEAGKATNKLELLTKLNGVSHEHAHDALNDVHATIAVARLIRDKQPKLFDYLLNCRHKQEVQKLVCQDGKPFVYACGRFPAETHKTTVAIKVADSSLAGACLVYDLRHDPAEFLGMDVDQLAQRLEWTRDEQAPKRLPVKELKFNRCPAVAPLQVLTSDAKSMERLELSADVLNANLKRLLAADNFAERVAKAYQLNDEKSRSRWDKETEVEGQLYDGLVPEGDKHVARAIRAAKPQDIMNFAGQLHDPRLQALLPRYKARNYPEQLSAEERQQWEAYVHDRLMAGGQQSVLAKYFARLAELAAGNTDSNTAYLLEELQLYGQSVMPSDSDYS